MFKSTIYILLLLFTTKLFAALSSEQQLKLSTIGTHDISHTDDASIVNINKNSFNKDRPGMLNLADLTQINKIVQAFQDDESIAFAIRSYHPNENIAKDRSNSVALLLLLSGIKQNRISLGFAQNTQENKLELQLTNKE